MNFKRGIYRIFAAFCGFTYLVVVMASYGAVNDAGFIAGYGGTPPFLLVLAIFTIAWALWMFGIYIVGKSIGWIWDGFKSS